MDFRKLLNLKGFTLLELLVVLILIGLISTIILANSNFLNKHESDQAQSYKSFIEFLSEESALTKKNIAWFIGNDKQYIATYKNNQWNIENIAISFFPQINISTLFQDNRGNIFTLNNERKDPFMVFYPSGKSSGGSIEFNKIDNKLTLKVDQFSDIEISTIL